MSEYGTSEIRTMLKSELPGVPISDSSDFRQLGFWNYNLVPKSSDFRQLGLGPNCLKSELFGTRL